MQYIKLAAVAVFSLMILLPLAGFRFGEGIVSEIDNRKLQENPFRAEERAKKKPMRDLISAYVSDRIGFRDDMILAYTILNDRLFGEMVHPSYRYGKDGYVYFKRMTTPIYGKYHETFADTVRKLQDYCEMRGVPFLFVFEPFKQRILAQHLPAGVHYDARWVDDLFHALDEREVHYVDNTVVLRQKMEEGEIVFNRQFDAGHWNDTGMHYGVNAILEELHKIFPQICPNNIETFETQEVLMSSLLVSKFPINENVPEIAVPVDNIEDISKLYETELERHKQLRSFGYFHNRAYMNKMPRVLFFQGSYLNRTNKFLQYALEEYIFVHDYQNVLDFSYYFNIFKPECVVFEAAEYTINDTYYDLKKMESLHLNPPLQLVMANMGLPAEQTLSADTISVEQGNVLTKIGWKAEANNIEYAWCLLGEEFDMRPGKKGGYEVTVKNEVWDKYKEQLKIITLEGKKLQAYQR